MKPETLQSHHDYHFGDWEDLCPLDTKGGSPLSGFVWGLTIVLDKGPTERSAVILLGYVWGGKKTLSLVCLVCFTKAREKRLEGFNGIVSYPPPKTFKHE